MCDNVYYTVTGGADGRGKCCPKTAGCNKNALGFDPDTEPNSICSTKCGNDCLGKIQARDYPNTMCAQSNTDNTSQTLNLPSCYADVAYDKCEELNDNVSNPIDVGADKCKGSDGVPTGNLAGCTSDGGDGSVCCEDGVEVTSCICDSSC